MANASTVTTLDAVHDGIVSTLAAHFPAVHIEAYLLDRKNLPIPACLVELTEMDAADLDPGTEQLAMMCRFEAKLVIGFRQGALNPKREIRKLAAAVAAFVRLQRWGCPIGPAEVIGAYPDDFEPELDQYEVWRVEWRQIIHLGATVWAEWNAGTPPTQVLAGVAPNIGAASVGAYVPVTP